MRWWSSFALTAAVLCVGQSSNRTYGYSKENKRFWLTCFKDLYASILSTRMSYSTWKSLFLEDNWVIACIASISMWFQRAKNGKLESNPYETSSAAAALQNDFKKRYKRAAKGLAAAVAKNGCFALQGKPFDSDKQRCCSGAENSRITICAAKWLQSGFEF